MADIVTLSLRLTEAEAALHKVAIGQAVELVQDDGSAVRFGKADYAKLVSYISSLRGQISDLTSVAPRRRGPVQFVF